jgi:PAS domain S-box-containing protein
LLISAITDRNASQSSPDGPASAFSRPPSLAFWLRWLAVACILPTFVVATALISMSYIREQAATAENSIVTARALMQTVDRELVRAQATLQTLATSPSLIAGDLADFHAQAKKVLEAVEFKSIVLSSLSGQQLLNSSRPFGVSLPQRSENAAMRRAIETGKPAISDLFLGSVSREPLVNVNVLVTDNGDPLYVLDATITPKNFEAIFRGQNPPPSWNLTLVDSSGTVVARSRDSDRYVGRKATNLTKKLNQGADEGAFENQTFDGVPALGAFSRSPMSHWTMLVGIPNATLNANLRATMWLSIAGAAAMLLVGFASSRLISLRISQSIRRLSEPAQALASGEPVVMPRVSIAEVQEVGEALAAAADLLKQREINQARVAATERQVAVSERVIARFSALMEAAPYALLVARRDGAISFVNGKVTELFGYQRTELLGQPVEILLADPLRGRHAAHRDGFFAAPEARQMGSGLALFGRRKDGTEFPIDVRLNPLEIDGQPSVMAAVQDITARKQLEAQIEASHLQAISSARLSSLGTMAGGIAHEINNPLAIIQALADDLAYEAETGAAQPAQVAAAARQITGMTGRIAKIIQGLRHLTRDGSHDPFVDTALSEVVATAIDFSQQAFEKSAVSLVVTAIDPGIRILCREVEISQIVLNLLQNALDAAQDARRPDGDPPWVRLETTVRNGRAVLLVIDSGAGVPAGLEGRIMEPFFTTKPVGKGTGLGLSLSRQIAEMHGGSIELGQSDGHTCFVLSLPLSRSGPASPD